MQCLLYVPGVRERIFYELERRSDMGLVQIIAECMDAPPLRNAAVQTLHRLREILTDQFAVALLKAKLQISSQGA